jgi:hypothetical protein
MPTSSGFDPDGTAANPDATRAAIAAAEPHPARAPFNITRSFPQVWWIIGAS